MTDQSMRRSRIAYFKDRRDVLKELIELRERQIMEFYGNISDYRESLLKVEHELAQLEREEASNK